MSSLTVTFLLLFFCTCAFAHMCLFSPPQRGPILGVNNGDAVDCSWSQDPCGGKYAAQTPYSALVRGTNFTVIWQKNENHWYNNNPGSFSLNWADSTAPTTFKEIYSFTDTNLPSLTIYSYILDVSHEIPATSKSGVLQLIYNCPGIKVVYYQCADVVILGN